MARGGYREPAKPSSVSGPGAKSRRTDGGPAQVVRDLTGGSYGEGQAFHDLQTSAPLANSAAQGAQGAPQGAPAAPVTPFGAPSTRPDEPVTAGNPLGPGPGPEAAGLGSGPNADPPNMTQLMAMLPTLNVIANGANGTPALRSLVRYLKSRA